MAENDTANGVNDKNRRNGNGIISDGYRLYFGILALVALGSYPFILHVLVSSYNRDIVQSDQMARFETKVEYFNLRVQEIEREQKTTRVIIGEFGAQMEGHELRMKKIESRIGQGEKTKRNERDRWGD